MDQSSIELYMMIGSHEPIVEWIKSEGVTKKSGAAAMLRGAAQSNVISSLVHGSDQISSTNGTIRRVLEQFEDDPEKKEEK